MKRLRRKMKAKKAVRKAEEEQKPSLKIFRALIDEYKKEHGKTRVRAQVQRRLRILSRIKAGRMHLLLPPPTTGPRQKATPESFTAVPEAGHTVSRHVCFSWWQLTTRPCVGLKGHCSACVAPFGEHLRPQAPVGGWHFTGGR